MSIGNRLKQVRQNKKLTVEEFSQIVNIPARTLGGYEREERKPPLEFLEILKNKFNVNINWLLTSEGEMFIKNESIHSLQELKEKYNLTDEELRLLNELLVSPEKRKGLLNLLK
ncbi:MAG: hypothetical protein ACD_20C00191G0005 [uncultured bacterium]|nr:MAG: hypothetical protein ACD_20C00191G0005 [uncultured bacterium]